MSLSVFELKPNMFARSNVRQLNKFDQDVYKGLYTATGTRDGRYAAQIGVPENALQLLPERSIAVKFPASVKNQRLSQAQ